MLEDSLGVGTYSGAVLWDVCRNVDGDSGISANVSHSGSWMDPDDKRSSSLSAKTFVAWVVAEMPESPSRNMSSSILMGLALFFRTFL